MAVTCIRRWYSTWTSCKCQPCVQSRYRHRKLSESSTGAPRVSSDEAWAALLRMVDADWTDAAIGSACGLTARSINCLRQDREAGKGRVIGAVIAAKIVGHGEPSAGHVGATGSRRKTQALALLGHTLDAIAEASDLNFTTIASVQTGHTRRITPRIAGQIDRAWRTLQLVPGSSLKARRRAEAAGWVSGFAFDDIDDPAETPKGVAGRVA